SRTETGSSRSCRTSHTPSAGRRIANCSGTRCRHSLQCRRPAPPEERPPMSSLTDWQVSPELRPKPQDYGYDLEAALGSMVALRAIIPSDAFTAETLGTERAGNGVIIQDRGVVLTIGYLITEAQSIWLHLADGRTVQGHVLGYDQETGFGLVQALARLDVPALTIGDS